MSSSHRRSYRAEPGLLLPLVPAHEDLAATTLEAVGSASTLEEFLHETYTDGFLVLKGGRVLCELYFNGMRPDSRHLLQSVSKSLCGVLTGELIESGSVDLRGDGFDLRSGAVGCGVR